MTRIPGAVKWHNDATKDYLRSVIAETQQRLERAERKIEKYKILLEQERTKKEAMTSYSGDMYYNGISRAVEVLDNAINDKIAVNEASAILRKTVKDVAEAKIKGKHDRSRRNEDAIIKEPVECLD